MTSEAKEYYYKLLNLTMAEPHPYKLPVIRKYATLDKPWYVEYYVFSVKMGVLRRKRIVLSEPTEKERMEFGKQMVAHIGQLLKEGAVVDSVKKKISKISINNASKISDAVVYWLTQIKPTVEPNTYDSYKRHLDHLLNFLTRHNDDSCNFSSFDVQKAYEFTDELISVVKHSNRTRNNVKDSCSIFFNYFIKRKVVTENPFTDIDRLRCVSKKYTAISKAHVRKLLDVFEEHGQTQLTLFVYFEYYAAMRPNKELRLLKIGDIMDQTVAVPCETSKSKEKEHVRIPPPLEAKIVLAKLREYPIDYYVFSKNGLPGPKPNGKKYQYVRHREHLINLGLDKLGYDIYSWKHSGVIALFLATKNLELVRQHCRHKDLATTIKYLRDLGQFVDYDEINKFPDI